jgi:putative ABC transport system permease protein
MGEFRAGFGRSTCTLANAFRLAVDSIRARKLRSFLTLLGVIIGVGSVVLVGAAIEGLGLYAEQSTSKIFGSESFLVSQVGTAGNMRQYLEKLRRNKRLRQEDYQYLQLSTGDKILYSPYRQRSEEIRHAGFKYEESVVLGAGANLPEIRDITLIDGRFFTAEEERTKQAVCVIGYDARAALFAGSTAVGAPSRSAASTSWWWASRSGWVRRSGAVRTIRSTSPTRYSRGCSAPANPSPCSRARGRNSG